MRQTCEIFKTLTEKKRFHLRKPADSVNNAYSKDTNPTNRKFMYKNLVSIHYVRYYIMTGGLSVDWRI